MSPEIEGAGCDKRETGKMEKIKCFYIANTIS